MGGMDLVRRLSSVQGRLSAGALFALSLVAGFWHGHAGEVDPVRLTACIGAGLAWLLAELAGGRPVSGRDRELFGAITTAIPQSRLDFLRDHDFGASFSDPGRNGFFEVAEWAGARYEFVDSTLQRAWSPVHARVRTFANLLAMNTYPVSGSSGFFTVHPTMGDPEAPEPFVQRRIDTLNEAATGLVRAIDGFERLASRRLQL